MKYRLLRFSLLSMLVMLCGGFVHATDPVTAKWDFQNGVPTSITETNIQGTDATGTVASNVEGIDLNVLAAVAGTNIKLQYNSQGYAQFNQNTCIQVPVKSNKDIVTVVSYPGQSKYTVGDENATGQNTFNHTATEAEVQQGYVEIIATETAYLYSIQVVQNEPKEEPEGPVSGTIFSATVIATEKQSLAAGTTEISSVIATIEGGKVYAINEQSEAKDLINKQGSVYYFSMTNNNTYFKIELDNAIAVDDVITADANGGVKNDASKGIWVSTNSARPSAAPDCAGVSTTDGIITNILNYAVTDGSEYVGAKTLYVYRAAGATEYFNNFKITRSSGQQEEPGDDPVDPEPHDPVLLTWDYTNKDIPTVSPDNGLYYAAYVNDAAGTNNGMHGVKLNSSGYAYFAVKPAVAGTLTLTFGNRKTTEAYAVNVYACTIADGVATKGNLIGEVAVAESPGTNSIDIPANITGIYIERKSTSEGVLSKIVFKETIVRSFVDFEMNLVELATEFETSTLPDGVTFTGTYKKDSHGYQGVTITVPVDGTVKFTIGGCQYANPANCKVKNAEGEVLATPNLRTATCYHQDGAAATYIYVGEPTTLTFSDIAYLPYFKAEATDVKEVTVTYKDQNGNKLGEKKVFEGDPIGEIPYTEADLTIPEGEKFRGWIYNSKIKVKTTDIVNGDITVKASVTPIEEAPSVGSIQIYDLTQATFYPEDHENFSVEGGQYYNNHGFDFAAGGSFTVAVTSKAQIVLNLCEYGSGTTIKVTDSQEQVVRDDVPAKAVSDGGTTVINYEGPASLLKFEFATQAYLHKVTVYNVSDFLTKDKSGYYIVPANDGAGLVFALNAAAAEPDSKIFLPNGTYDLGEATLTGINGENVSIIGQSMENVIIKNAPAIEKEGLGSADLFLNTSTGLYLQDLTLQNALDYYNAGAAGRAAVLEDKGDKTIGKNVTMLSYQDTYYSNNNSMKAYWETCDIHGTIDFICGGGDVRFQNTIISLEKRQVSADPEKDGKGGRTITAPTSTTNFGYVFDGCTIVDLAEGKGDWNFGRTWKNDPVCMYMNTTLDDNAKNTIIAKRWTEKGMNNTNPKVFGEFGTKDATGTDITPASNEITSYDGVHETILTAEQAAAYSYDKMFSGNWKPAQLAAQLEAPDAEYADGTVTWTPANNGAIAYMIEKNGEFVGITAGNSMTVEADAEKDKLTIRAANGRGGFGEAKQVAYTATSIQAINAAIERGEQVIYNLAGQRVNKASKGMYIINGQKIVVK